MLAGLADLRSCQDGAASRGCAIAYITNATAAAAGMVSDLNPDYGRL